eukprot:6874534-Prymnesium_polylepis.1
MYIETSSPRVLGDLFDLSYTCPQSSAAQLSWWYHMYGGTIGHLRVKDGSGATLWVKSGNQGNAWQSASVQVSSTPFTFEGERGTATKGDIAVDSVVIACFDVPPSPPPPPPKPPSPRYYTFVHDGHCAGGWIRNPSVADIDGCADACRDEVTCGYFAFSSAGICALYTLAG